MKEKLTEFEALSYARTLARQINYFIVVKPDAYILYRSMSPHNIKVGKRSTAVSMLRMIKNLRHTEHDNDN